MFRVTVSGPREQEASFFTVVVWRDQAEHAAESLAKGSRVVVVGRGVSLRTQGRPGNDTTVTGEPASPTTQARTGRYGVVAG